MQLYMIVAKEAGQGQLFMKKIRCAYLGHSSHSTNQQNIADITLIDVGILQTFLAGIYSPLNEFTDEGFKL